MSKKLKEDAILQIVFTDTSENPLVSESVIFSITFWNNESVVFIWHMRITTE